LEYPSLNKLRTQGTKFPAGSKNFELSENTIKMLEKEKIEMNEKQDEIFNNERNLNQVIKLNHWEYENLKYKETNKNLLSTYEGLEIDSLNYLNHMKESFAKLNLRNISDQLLEFYIKCEEEQGSMLLQSVNINKSKFDYEVFLSGKDKKNTNKILNYFLELNKTKDKKKFLTGDQDENIQKIKEYEKKGVLDIIGKADFYRDIIKEKLKIEEIYHTELIKIADLIFKKKYDIKSLTNISREISNYLKNLNIEYENKKEDFEAKINLIQLSYNQSFLRSSSIFGGVFKEKESAFKERETSIFASMNNSNNTNAYKNRAEQRQAIISLQKQVSEIDSQYKSASYKYEKSLEDKKVNLEAAKNEIKRLKSIYHYLCKDQKIYYCEILKLGIDVRAEGLCWVVKKLIQLNTHLEYSMFPHFLNHYHIDYLIKYSYKTVELNLLKLAGKTYRIKIDKIRSDNNRLQAAANLQSEEKQNTLKIQPINVNPVNTISSTANSKASKILRRQTLGYFNPTIQSIPLRKNASTFLPSTGFKNYMDDINMNINTNTNTNMNMNIQPEYATTETNFGKTNNSNLFTSKLTMNLEKFFNNDNYLMQTYYSEKMEEESVDKIVSVLKKRIKNFDDSVLDKDVFKIYLHILFF
jgi:hypothetical protein